MSRGPNKPIEEKIFPNKSAADNYIFEHCIKYAEAVEEGSHWRIVRYFKKTPKNNKKHVPQWMEDSVVAALDLGYPVSVQIGITKCDTEFEVSRILNDARHGIYPDLTEVLGG